MPVPPSGKRRPCKPLLQLVVVALRRLHSIGRSIDVYLRRRRSDLVILLNFLGVAYSGGDTNRRAVWLGRHPTEKISVGPNDKLIQVGNLELSARAKAYLTVSCTAKDAEMKVGPSDPSWFFNGTRVWQKRYLKDNRLVAPDSPY